MERFDNALTLLSPAFLLPTSPNFFPVLLSLGSDSIINTGQSHLSSSLSRQGHRGSGREGGRCRLRHKPARKAVRLRGQPCSLAPRFVRDSKAPFLHPLPHHLLTKPCLRKGFCQPAPDCCKGRCNLHFLAVPG